MTFVKNTSSKQIITYKITWPFGVTFRERISNTKATTETVGNPLKYSGHALDIAASSSSIFAREDDMFKLSVMDNIEINCQVPTLNMPVTTFHDLRNCSSPDSQYKSLEKKERLKLHHLIKIPRWNGKLVCLKKIIFTSLKTGLPVCLFCYNLKFIISHRIFDFQVLWCHRNILNLKCISLLDFLGT